MINLYENESATGVDVDGTGFMFYDSSQFVNRLQPLIDATEAVIVPYAASAAELADVIATKQAEVRAHYETLHGESLASVTKRLAAASPSVVTTANAITNIAIADGGLAAIAALIDKATVDAYSVVGLAWS